MARAVLITCDIDGCGQPALGCSFYVDRGLDAAGSMDDENDTLDLCPQHQWAAYKEAEKLLSFEDRKKVVSALRAYKVKRR